MDNTPVICLLKQGMREIIVIAQAGSGGFNLTEPSGKLSWNVGNCLEKGWQFKKKSLAGDWMNRPSITIVIYEQTVASRCR